MVPVAQLLYVLLSSLWTELTETVRVANRRPNLLPFIFLLSHRAKSQHIVCCIPRMPTSARVFIVCRHRSFLRLELSLQLGTSPAESRRQA